MTENASVDSDDLVLAWQRGDRPGQVEFVVTASQAEEFLVLLAGEGVSAVSDPLLVRGPGLDVLTTVAAMAGTPAAWTAVGLAVRKFFDRHKGKRIRVDESGLIEAENYSAGDIERIVRALSGAEQDDSGERR